MDRLDWIRKWADYTPNKIALTSFERNETYSYAQLDTYADRLIDRFVDIGLSEGDRVAVLSEHCLEYIVLFVACQRMGLMLVPLNFRFSNSELARLIKDCTPSLMVVSDSQKDKLPTLDISDIKMLSREVIREIYMNPIGVCLRDLPIKEENPVFIFYTSGTTGAPKGVLYTNKMMFWNSLNTSMQLGITYRDSTINSLPPYHTSGWNIFVTPLLHKGGHICMVEKFDPEKVLRLLSIYDTTLFMALPTMLLMMQKSPVFKEVELSNLRYIISGGETVPSSMVSYWKEEKGILIRPGYGLTEAGPSITSLHHNMILTKPNSIGKPNFYLELKILNKNGELAKTNEIGELCIKGEVVTPGYWNNSVKTKSKIKNGWLHTGDFAHRDEDGFLYIKGRKNDMYISGGENIYPQEIEMHLEQIKEVKKAVVLSVEDEKWGQCGLAFVAKMEGSNLKVETIKNYLDQTLVSFKHPRSIFILDEIPLTSLSKVSRKKLLKYFKTISQE